MDGNSAGEISDLAALADISTHAFQNCPEEAVIQLLMGANSDGWAVILGERKLILAINNPVDPAGNICSCQRLSHASLSLVSYGETAEGSLNQL